MSGTYAVEVRLERSGDEASIRHVNDQAFGQLDESRIVDAVREAGEAVASLVAVDRSRIVGHILFTSVSIEARGLATRVVGLGPMSVLPEVQRQGIGSALVRRGLQECARLDYAAVVVIGHPEFYPRFGFRPGRDYGLRCEFDVPDEVFMVAELVPGALVGVSGLVRYVPEFGAA